ncbi:hypothetical protein MJO28_002175 [Puccinia striiformis f. sp. tritici]|uniref:Uncharacterized protein n=1 Tax=Puccinia striiformis f. sp. tritici TaxID=168172 RepID=A0ACC0EX46_9BASI|nr:hypothetical protein MJO28_002175 [Puccinia striiformis f. sp. tritici]
MRYTGVFFMAAGIYPSVPSILCILPNNTAGLTKQSVATALQLMVGAQDMNIYIYIYKQTGSSNLCSLTSCFALSDCQLCRFHCYFHLHSGSSTALQKRTLDRTRFHLFGLGNVANLIKVSSEFIQLTWSAAHRESSAPWLSVFALEVQCLPVTRSHSLFASHPTIQLKHSKYLPNLTYLAHSMHIRVVSLVNLFSFLHLTKLTSTSPIIGLSSPKNHAINKRCLPIPDCLNDVFSYFRERARNVADQVGGVSHEAAQRQWHEAVTYEHSSSPLVDESYWKGKSFNVCKHNVLTYLLREVSTSNEVTATSLRLFSKKLIEPIEQRRMSKSNGKIYDPLHFAIGNPAGLIKPSSASTIVNHAPSLENDLDSIRKGSTFKAIDEIDEQDVLRHGKGSTEPLSGSKSLGDAPGLGNRREPPLGLAAVSREIEGLKESATCLGEDMDLSRWSAMWLRFALITSRHEVFQSAEWDGWREVLLGHLITIAYWDRTSSSKETITGELAAKELLHEEKWLALSENNCLRPVEDEWWMEFKGE